MSVSKGKMAFVVYKYLSVADKSEQFILKGAGGMKLARDFELPFSCFSSDKELKKWVRSFVLSFVRSPLFD